MDHTAATIFSAKKAALGKGDLDMKEGVKSGKDLMSILRGFSTLVFLLPPHDFSA